MEEEAVESVSVHHGQKHCAMWPQYAAQLAQCLPDIGTVKIAQNFNADHKIETFVGIGELSRYSGNDRSARILADRDCAHGVCRLQPAGGKTEFVCTVNVFPRSAANVQNSRASLLLLKHLI